MRIDAAYEQFLSSSGPRAYLQRKIDQAESFRLLPPLAELVTATRNMAPEDDKDGIDEAIRHFLKGDTRFILECMRSWILEAAEDVKALPPFREAIEFDSGLFHNVNLLKKFGISLTVSSISERDVAASRARGEATRVVFSGQQVFFKFLAGDNVSLTIWECDPYDDRADFPRHRCWKARDIEIVPGDILEIDGSYQSLSFGACEGTAVFLQAENLTKDIGTSVAFDTSGSFIATYPTDRTALRRMVMCSALKHMGADARLKDLPPAALEGPFYLRWHFLREIVAASPIDQVDLLANVAGNDPNPSVRRAASATLDMLKKRNTRHVN